MLKDRPQTAFFWLVGRKHREVQIIVGARDNKDFSASVLMQATLLCLVFIKKMTC